MNGELLQILDHIEREKGIKREILISAVESAMVSAFRKTVEDKAAEITVTMDPQDGQIKVFVNGKEVKSKEMGRIAAQTAKQVIMQRICEAERDVIFNEYAQKLGSITNGTIHRFEKGNIVVDLGKTEAIIPKKEQSPRETYKQGERVRALILDVRKTSKGPQVVLSRTSEGLVKRLFELEVPEIYEGIVEIKAISREPGDRTKIAVYSKDEKVDSIGACVGMRGQRVRNIVKELHGEKIDIVRWSKDIKEFVPASLSPAKVSEIKVDKEGKRVQVIVEDDQLSLAIGKKGQNVRLASRLTGLDIDIKSRTTLIPKVEISLSELPGVGPKTKEALEEAGFRNVDAIAKATPEDLAKAKGIGQKSAEKIHKSAVEFLKAPKPKNEKEEKQESEDTKEKEE